MNQYIEYLDKNKEISLSSNIEKHMVFFILF